METNHPIQESLQQFQEFCDSMYVQLMGTCTITKETSKSSVCTSPREKISKTSHVFLLLDHQVKEIYTHPEKMG
jgi:hypothetical protein